MVGIQHLTILIDLSLTVSAWLVVVGCRMFGLGFFFVVKINKLEYNIYYYFYNYKFYWVL